MKKLLFSIFAAAALVVGFSSCQDDDELNLGPSKTESAAAAAVANFNGNWTVTVDDVTTSYPGSLSTSAADNANVLNISAAADGVTEINGASALVNVSWAGNDILLVNSSVTNGFATFSKASAASGLSGIIEQDGDCALKFTLTVKSGRSSKTKFFEFRGKK